MIEYVIALGVMTMIAVVTGWLLAGRALSPLREITSTARRVSGENLGERIALRGPADELKRLADTFDGMLERHDDALASQRHFVANASHELRTPLAIMRTEVDVCLADPAASAGDLRAMGEAIRETVDRCERLIASLLVLARSEAAPGRAEPVDVAALAGDCITDLRVSSREAGIDVRDDLELAWVGGDPGLLERLIANLLDNGIRHNERGGFLTVAQALTKPFRRLDRSVAGFGLGIDAAAPGLLAANPSDVHVRANVNQMVQVSNLLAATADPQNADGVTVSRPSNALEARAAAKGQFTTLLLGLGAVALLVGAIGIANIMVISVLERRTEIGLRRALGAKRGYSAPSSWPSRRCWRRSAGSRAWRSARSPP